MSYSRNEACHCSARETIIQLPVFTKETVKVQEKKNKNKKRKTPQVYFFFLVERQN